MSKSAVMMTHSDLCVRKNRFIDVGEFRTNVRKINMIRMTVRHFGTPGKAARMCAWRGGLKSGYARLVLPDALVQPVSASASTSTTARWLRAVLNKQKQRRALWRCSAARYAKNAFFTIAGAEPRNHATTRRAYMHAISLGRRRACRAGKARSAERAVPRLPRH
jgi:hypothetical protein